ncbi:MAG TPA: hypothetical protein VMT37_16490 [Solirubrobacterales bacterium]|nr:hypothetical protein [Solirubrobacterales bacterium]
MSLDRHSLEQAADGFGLAFYLLIAGALFSVVTGTLGIAVFLLILAALAHVGRWTLEEHVAARGDEARIEIDFQRIQDLIGRLRRPS